MAYLGLDLGTSGVKALLIGEDQRILGSAHAPLTVSRLHPGWSEQDPADWISATEAVLDALRAEQGAALSGLRGIGLSGHMHGATVLDAEDRPLRPCILWNDVRSHVEAAELDADPRFRALTGNIVFPGFTAPKLLWIRRHEPELFAKIRRVLLPKDHLRLWLTGEAVSEMSDASGTSWLDVGGRRWSPELLAATDLDADRMPRLVEGSEVSGRLRPDLAARWGLPPGVVVAGGAGDNAASACGVGAARPGAAFASLGTSGVLFASTAGFAPNPASAVHAFCHALPGIWHQMGVILSAADALNWFGRVMGREGADLVAALGETPRAPSGVAFLPYLSGERTPHNDAAARGAFLGLGHEAGPEALTQAVLEGVAFAFRDSLAALEQAGTRLERVTAVGGGSRSRLWLKILATALDLPVDLPADGDFGAAFGAARLGLIAAEGADPLAICAPPLIRESFDPDPALRGPYDEAYARWRRLYPALKGVA
ncbi:xylulokinase [Neomegalonema sp.]|uniref:xylulokinase n=1 Tax=Neomegalonema sp. TaxID=2039713 RepID=UPI002629B44E|nr:xylulokinase [Neomegalonema sp.]MDD2870225.1 xylulokinase [Neomegalonema sp.]